MLPREIWRTFRQTACPARKDEIGEGVLVCGADGYARSSACTNALYEVLEALAALDATLEDVDGRVGQSDLLGGGQGGRKQGGLDEEFCGVACAQGVCKLERRCVGGQEGNRSCEDEERVDESEEVLVCLVRKEWQAIDGRCSRCSCGLECRRRRLSVR